MASMTINYARESVVDFTKPFMNMGIGILFKVRNNIISCVPADRGVLTAEVRGGTESQNQKQKKKDF